MRKGWQIIISVVLLLAILGAVCIGVGFITGAETSRIYAIFDDKYSISLYYDYIVNQLIPAFQEAGVI